LTSFIRQARVEIVVSALPTQCVVDGIKPNSVNTLGLLACASYAVQATHPCPQTSFQDIKRVTSRATISSLRNRLGCKLFHMGDTCEMCVLGPARYFSVNSSAGFIILYVRQNLSGSFCGRCAEYIYLKAQRRNILLGWAGIISIVYAHGAFVLNAIRLHKNRKALPFIEVEGFEMVRPKRGIFRDLRSMIYLVAPYGLVMYTLIDALS